MTLKRLGTNAIGVEYLKKYTVAHAINSLPCKGSFILEECNSGVPSRGYMYP